MTERDLPIIGQGISQLIRAIDTRYMSGALEDIEELEAVLEDQMESLDAALSEIEDESEWAADLEPDPGDGCSIEAQFRSAYAQHVGNPLIFFPDEDLADHLRAALERSQRGGMTPSGFRGAQANSLLVDLARELFWEQRLRIARLLARSLSPDG